jgi:hypothetical protein
MGARGEELMNTINSKHAPKPPVPTREQLAQLGLGGVAYLRAVTVDGAPAVAIFGADGRQIGLAPDVAQAAAAVFQHEMIPVWVH